MTRESTLIVLGILVSISLFIGLPLSLLEWVLPLVGLLIVGIGVTLRKKRLIESVAKEAEESVGTHVEARPSPYHAIAHEFTTTNRI